jgi:WD40 repeat protein
MSQINVNTITDEAGTGPVNFPYDFTIAGSPLVIPPAHNPVSVSGATQALNVGSYNFFNANDLTVDTTLSFTSVPTNALWTYTANITAIEVYTLEAASYSGLSFSVYPEEGTTWGLAFSSDGTKMYIVGQGGRTVYQYTLATAWDASTATYASISFWVPQDSDPTDLAFSSDGTKMYIVGNTNNTIFQYTLATAWNVSTATYASSKSIAAQDTSPRGITFSPDGLKMYMIGDVNHTVYQYTLSTAWDISTATYASLSKSVTAQEASPQAVAFSSDGLKMFVVGYTNDTVYQYTLSTAWNVSTATYASISFYVYAFAGLSTPRAMVFSPDGLKMYIIGNAYNIVRQYNTALLPIITIPAAVENPPTTALINGDQVSYTFVTNDGGTTVNLINETVL